MITERDGNANYTDLVEGISIREVMDEATGISAKVVTDWRQQARGSDLKPRILLRDDAGNAIKLPSGLDAAYYLSVDAFSRSRTAPRAGPAACRRVSAEKRRRRATPPASCRVFPSCSRRAVRRTSRSSRTSTAGLS